MKIAFLGPKGTFTEEALLTQSELVSGQELIAIKSIEEIYKQVEAGTVDLGFVPIENAIEGTVTLSLDNLIFNTDVLIQAEVHLPIHMQIGGIRNAKLSEIKKLISFPVALAQVRNFIANSLEDVEIESASSTAEAMKIVAERDDASIAAVGPRLAAEQFGLEVLAENVEDIDNNETRFFVISKSGIPKPTGHDKTSIVCFQQEDRPGNLQMILGQFSSRGVNLCKLESRTTKQGLGSYCFVLDVEGHIVDPVVADSLVSLKAAGVGVKFLGSYSAAGKTSDDRRSEAAAQWSDADQWVRALIAQVSE